MSRRDKVAREIAKAAERKNKQTKSKSAVDLVGALRRDILRSLQPLDRLAASRLWRSALATMSVARRAASSACAITLRAARWRDDRARLAARVKALPPRLRGSFDNRPLHCVLDRLTCFRFHCASE